MSSLPWSGYFREVIVGMGLRGELYSTRIFVEEGSKTFFFNVKENRFGDVYLNIVESRKGERGFHRSSLIIFDENLEQFLTHFEQALALIQKRRLADKIRLEQKDGRRFYEFRLRPQGRKRSLQIDESRSDDTGEHRESIVIPMEEIEAFQRGMNKALSFIPAKL